MKNIEKYPNTKGALDAYNSLASKTVSFEAWLVCEYKEPHAPTLLETANAATKAWCLHFPGDTLASSQGQSTISSPPLSARSLSRARSVARKSYAAHNRVCRAVEVVKKGDMK